MYVHKLVAVHAQGAPALLAVPVHVAAGPLATLVHCAPAPPAQVPTLCGSQDAWLIGPEDVKAIPLQATFVDAGTQVPAATNASGQPLVASATRRSSYGFP